jgi:hypothetical protein
MPIEASSVAVEPETYDDRPNDREAVSCSKMKDDRTLLLLESGATLSTRNTPGICTKPEEWRQFFYEDAESEIPTQG